MSGSKRPNEKEPRHVRLYHWFMKTEAWRDLSPVQRCAYIELAARYGGPGSNNGMIPYSMAELVDALHISKSTSHAALKALQDHGFIVLTRQGGFNIKHRHAAEWLLTEFKDDRPGKGLSIPSKNFARWKKSEHGSATVPHRVRSPNRAGTVAEQSQKETVAYGSATVPDEMIDGSARVPLLVYQGQTALSASTEAAPLVEEAPHPKGGRHRNEQAAGPISVSDALSNSKIMLAARRGVA